MLNAHTNAPVITTVDQRWGSGKNILNSHLVNICLITLSVASATMSGYFIGMSICCIYGLYIHTHKHSDTTN